MSSQEKESKEKKTEIKENEEEYILSYSSPHSKTKFQRTQVFLLEKKCQRHYPHRDTVR